MATGSVGGMRFRRRACLVGHDVAHDRDADGVGGGVDVVVIVDGHGRRGHVLALEDPEAGRLRRHDVGGLPHDERRELADVDRRAEGLGEIVEVREPLDGVEHPDGLALGAERPAEGRRRLLEEVLHPGERFLGIRNLGEVDREQAHDQALGLQRHRETRAVPGDAPDERIVGHELVARQNDRLAVADELVDVARVPRSRAAQHLFDALALGPDAEEDGMNRVGRPEERRVRSRHRRAPSGRPARGLREVFTQRELRQRRDLGFVGRGEPSACGLDRLVVL